MKFRSTAALLLIAFQAKAQHEGSLAARPDALAEVVVSGSRTSDSLRRSPVSMQVLTARQIALAPAPSFFDALQGVQGVQVLTPSLGFKVLNARGFANTTNVRFAQLVDGLDVASPHIGGAIGNALGPGDLDIERVELVPGVASALYGMNTVNGLANFSTRNPFVTEGLSISQQTGANHLGDDEVGIKPFSNTALRYAKKLGRRLAFKINGAYTRGYDWMAHDYTDLNSAANSSTGLTGADNPAADPVNSYGNESSNRRTVTLGGKSYVVARTGYTERDLADYTLENIRGDLGLYYRTARGGQLAYTGRMAVLGNIYQRANRFRLDHYRLQQHALQYTSPSVNARLYYNAENSGDSYNLRSMGENIDRSFKADNAWYADYATAFAGASKDGASTADAHRAARAAADAGRYQPGTDAFGNTLQRLQQINNWDSGAALKVRASFLHGEAQANLTERWRTAWKENAGVEVLVGADYRVYFIYPDGNYFVNPVAGKSGEDIRYGKVGGYTSIRKTLLKGTLQVGAILRADKNDYFPVSFSPRGTAVYVPNGRHSFRLSYQSGYRHPSIFEAYSNVNSGGVKRVGGLPVMSSGIFEHAYLASSITAFQQAVLNDVNKGGQTKADAIARNSSLLQKNPYSYLQPEQVSSLEGGYRAALFHGRLSLVLDGYYSLFRNFIAQANMNVPKTTDPDSVAFALNEKSRQAQYRMYTNSRTRVYNYGISAGAMTAFRHGLTAGVNASFAQLRRASDQDGLEDGFNTPQWTVNATADKRDLLRNLDAGIAWHWQTGYFWQSFLVSGDVPAFDTWDAQVSYRMPERHVHLKLGASNLLNKRYVSFLGGPSIGGLYYLTVTYGAL